MYKLWRYALQNINSDYLSDRTLMKFYFSAYLHFHLFTISIFYLCNKNTILKFTLQFTKVTLILSLLFLQ